MHRTAVVLASLESSAVIGIEATPVHIEVDLCFGLPRFQLVGLPDTSVKESRDRVRGHPQLRLRVPPASHRHQHGAGRRPQGGRGLRPAHCPGRAGRVRRGARPRHSGRDYRGRTGSGWHHPPGARRAAHRRGGPPTACRRPVAARGECRRGGRGGRPAAPAERHAHRSRRVPQPGPSRMAVPLPRHRLPTRAGRQRRTSTWRTFADRRSRAARWRSPRPGDTTSS